MKYLYGASVKKIQSYIFESSKLQEIAGASELVEYVCTTLFDKLLGFRNAKVQKIIQAAGNIRAVIEDRETAEEIMLKFPKSATEAAPGIQLVQGIVELKNEKLTAADSQDLEDILKKQTPVLSPYKDWSVTRKAPRSGRALYQLEDGEAYDIASWKKREVVNLHWRNLEKKFGVEKPFQCNMEKLAGKDNFVAVIHADGNSLGKTLMKLKDSPDYGEKWCEFSQELDKATTCAAKRSYDEVFNQAQDKFRAIILGGDDLTVVCAAEYAIDFTKKYLEYFKDECKKRHDVLGPLTACAGIAFIKTNFPFYYGVELAEMLCAASKKEAKAHSENPVPSSFLFAKELGSFVDESFAAFTARNLTIQTEQDDVLSLVYGPYKTARDEHGGEMLPFIDDLQDAADCLQYSPLHSAIRKMITELHISTDSAKLLADRAEAIAEEKGERAKKAISELKEKLCALSGKQEHSLYKLLCSGKKSPMLDLLTAQQFTVAEKGKE